MVQILPQGLQGALLDHLREGVQGVRLPQEVLPGAQAALQADPRQGGDQGKEEMTFQAIGDIHMNAS